MQRVALHSRILPGHEADYEREHAVIPLELDAALRRAGVHDWTIWRDGTDLFHLVLVDDFAAMQAALQHDPADQAWQPHIGAFLVDGGQGLAPIPTVWTLPD
ncbi:L-rhamnose mutarotase, partial [Subtercola sp. Z020]|uniref:L-rhamnose mutarotase n=1 Tax=Subtercola sp. Z020 TaxID=2080582 RepID=UPI000CE79948